MTLLPNSILFTISVSSFFSSSLLLRLFLIPFSLLLLVARQTHLIAFTIKPLLAAKEVVGCHKQQHIVAVVVVVTVVARPTTIQANKVRLSRTLRLCSTHSVSK